MVYKGRSARNVDAQLNLAIPYYEGTGVEQSKPKLLNGSRKLLIRVMQRRAGCSMRWR
jgi:hypothetical protein